MSGRAKLMRIIRPEVDKELRMQSDRLPKDEKRQWLSEARREALETDGQYFIEWWGERDDETAE